MSNVISQTLTKNPFQWRLAKIWSTIALTWQHKIYLATLLNLQASIINCTSIPNMPHLKGLRQKFLNTYSLMQATFTQRTKID